MEIESNRKEYESLHPNFVSLKNHFFERKVINTANAKMHGSEFFKDSSLLFEAHVEKMIPWELYLLI